MPNNKINLSGGSLTLEQLDAIFKTIPQEFDVVDENDTIVWSSMNEGRLFERTTANLGKNVLDVHAKKSKPHVKRVLEQMHNNERKSLSINLWSKRWSKNQPINVSFYSLHNESGDYIGCVEVTQPTKDYQWKWRRLKNFLHIIFKKR